MVREKGRERAALILVWERTGRENGGSCVVGTAVERERMNLIMGIKQMVLARLRRYQA